MRALPVVIEQILAEIPATETDLISTLKSVQQSARYSAPEFIGHWWDKGASVLAHYAPSPVDGWQKRVADIWAGDAVTTQP